MKSTTRSSDLPSGYWDGVGKKYGREPHYLDAFLSEMKRQAYLDLIRDWNGLPVVGSVLKTDLFEEATGAGMFLGHLVNDGADITGMDVSTEIVAMAKENLESMDIRWEVADTRSLPFDDESFDLIISPSTLDHFPDPADLGVSLREIRRVLKPGGRLIITLDNRQNVTDFLLRIANRMKLIPYYLGRSYSIRELQDELTAAGLVVEDTTAILHNPRLFAVAMVFLGKLLRWRPLTVAVQQILTAMQRSENSRWRYRTGSFVAALATKR